MTYGVQDLSVFLTDFGLDVSFQGSTGLGILDTPDEIFVDGQVQGTVYQLIYKTSDFCFKFDDIITVDSIEYKVKEAMKMDDGSFSKAFLYKI